MTAVALGAAGAVGPHVVDALLARSRAVRAVTRTPMPLPDGAEPHVADLRDPAALRVAVAGADVVVHAARPTPRGACASPWPRTCSAGTPTDGWRW